MIATLRMCPGCGGRQWTNLDPSWPARCPRCGARYQTPGGARKRQAEALERRTSVAAGNGGALPAGVLVAEPLPAFLLTAEPAPGHFSVPDYTSNRARIATRVAAVLGVLIMAVGLPLALVMVGKEPERPLTVEPYVHPQTAVEQVEQPARSAMGGDGALVPLAPPLQQPAAAAEESFGKVEKAARAIYQTVALAAPAAGSPAPAASRIDELVFAKLKEKGIIPADPCSEGTFVRRVYLDVIGTLPTAEEAKAFLNDTDPNKRRTLIDRLLERPEFADYWTMKWGDILRVKSEFPINLWPNAVRSYHHWIRTAVRENRPYDQFVRDLLTSSGSNFRDPPANFYRAIPGRDPKTIAHAVGLTFMGVRPEGLAAERWSGMETFFSQVAYKKTGEWKEEIVFYDSLKPLKATEAVFPDGTKVSLAADQDPRFAFADWLITPENPWFTRNIANRVWSWLLGRGIIHEPDDVRPDNPPSNPELLAYLEKELIAARYDLKHLYRLILNSKTYQLSCIAASKQPEAAALFAFYPVRRLEAEVLIDAISQVTGTTEKYSSPIPEPFTYLPPGHRAIGLPDASISSAFLEMFGRPPRDTGLESERNNNFTAGQRLHLLNSAHIRTKIEQGPRLAGLLGSGRPPAEMAEDLYLIILSRYPTADEVAAVSDYAPSGAGGRGPAADIAWALINSAEFLCRH